MQGLERVINELQSYTITKRKLLAMQIMAEYLKDLNEINGKTYSFFNFSGKSKEITARTEQLIQDLENLK